MKDEQALLFFQNGILGFDGVKRYTLSFPGEESPFCSLRAEGGGSPSFVVCDPLWFVPTYPIPAGRDVLERLAAVSAEDLRVLSIVNLSAQAREATINLKAPIVINLKNHRADQFVLDDPALPIQYRLFHGGA